MKKSLTLFGIMFTLYVTSIIILFFINNRNSNKTKKYLNEINLQANGIIIFKSKNTFNSHGQHNYLIKLNYCNKIPSELNKYDDLMYSDRIILRSKNKLSFGKDILTPTIEIGDSIIIDKYNYTVFRNDKLIIDRDVLY